MLKHLARGKPSFVWRSAANEGENNQKTYSLISQNTRRNDEGIFSLSFAAPNSATKFTPNNFANYRVLPYWAALALCLMCGAKDSCSPRAYLEWKTDLRQKKAFCVWGHCHSATAIRRHLDTQNTYPRDSVSHGSFSR